MKKRIGVDENARWYKVIDLDTGKEIKNCIAADDETGEYEVYKLQTGGCLELDSYGDTITEFKKGNIQLIDSKLETNAKTKPKNNKT